MNPIRITIRVDELIGDIRKFADRLGINTSEAARRLLARGLRRKKPQEMPKGFANWSKHRLTQNAKKAAKKSAKIRRKKST